MSLPLLAWRGYVELFKKLQLGPKCDVTQADNALAVLELFERGPEDYAYVVVDHEFKEDYEDLLLDLEEMGIERRIVLKSALPALAASEYYTVGDAFCLVPIRFGTNGIVCRQEVIPKLRKLNVIEERLGFEVFKLADFARASVDSQDVEVHLWDFPTAIIQMLTCHFADWKRNQLPAEPKVSSPDSWKELANWIAELVRKSGGKLLGNLADARTVLEECERAFVIGPSEMLAWPISSAGTPVDWWLLSGGGLLWLEAIGVSRAYWRKQGNSGKDNIRKTLQSLIDQLEGDPVWGCDTDPTSGEKDIARWGIPPNDALYWGYPVLGWPASKDTKRIDLLRGALRKLGVSERLPSLRHINPSDAFSDFLLSAAADTRGVALRRPLRVTGQELTAIMRAIEPGTPAIHVAPVHAPEVEQRGRTTIVEPGEDRRF